MNRVVITTKKSNKAYLIAGILVAVLFAGFAMYLNSYIGNMSSFELAFSKTASSISTCVTILYIVAFVELMWTILCAMSYADVYEDKIVGKGMEKLNLRDFHLDYSQITDISYSGLNLYISTVGGKYKIITNAVKAKEVFNYYNKVKNTQ